MIIDSVAALRLFSRSQKEHREREKIDSIIRYSRNKTKPSLGKILGSVELEHGSEAFIARRLIAGCHTRNRCGLYGCPNCGRRFKAKAKLEVLKTIACRCGRLPDRDEVSWVTINGPRVRVEDYREVAVAATQFRKKLTKLRAKHVKGTSWIGYFDISLKGVIHWHGIVLHPEQSRMKLTSVLRGELPGNRVVRVMELDRNKSLFDNLESVVDYSLVADRHAKVQVRKSRAVAGVPELIPCEGLKTAELIAHRIVALQYMAQRGLQGIRLCLNMRSPRVWKAGVMFDKSTGEVIVVPEIEKMILEKRKEAKKRRRDRGWNPNWKKKGIRGQWSSKMLGENLLVRPYATGLLGPSHSGPVQTPNEKEVMAAGTDETEAVRGILIRLARVPERTSLGCARGTGDDCKT